MEKKDSPTNHNKASFDIVKAYGIKPSHHNPSPPRRKSRRRRRSASNENIYRWSPKSAMQSPRSKSAPRSHKRSSSHKRQVSPIGALRQPQILQAIMAGLNAKANRPGLAGLFPNEARNTVGKHIKAFPMKTCYEFAVGNRDIMNPSKKYGDYRPVTTADIDNDEFRKHLAQSARSGP